MALKFSHAALAAALMLLALVRPAAAETTASPPGAKAYIISPAQGAHLKSPFLVRFGLSGMGIAPAGTQAAGTGHHHLLVDTALPPAGEPIATDAHHLHFGKGQTEAMVTLPPGQHTLQLLVGDWSHIPLQPSVASAKITVTVDK